MTPSTEQESYVDDVAAASRRLDRARAPRDLRARRAVPAALTRGRHLRSAAARGGVLDALRRDEIARRIAERLGRRVSPALRGSAAGASRSPRSVADRHVVRLPSRPAARVDHRLPAAAVLSWASSRRCVRPAPDRRHRDGLHRATHAEQRSATLAPRSRDHEETPPSHARMHEGATTDRTARRRDDEQRHEHDVDDVNVAAAVAGSTNRNPGRASAPV